MIPWIFVLGQIVVSPAGRDDAAGTAEEPFATLERAREEARKRPGSSVQLRGGTYFLEETLVLGPDDSGRTWSAWPGETPVLSGGLRLEGWKEQNLDGRKVWAAESPETRQLFVGGERRSRPRLPREGTYQIAEVLDAGPDVREGSRRFRFKEGELKASWTNLEDIDVVAYHFWHEERLPLVSIDGKERIATSSKRSIRRLTEAKAGQPARYVVENVLEALREPGEWYWDRRHGVIYLIPKPGEDPATLEAVVPRLRHVLAFVGAERVVFRGITVAHSEALCPPRSNQAPDIAGPSQAAVTAPGALLFERSKECAFEDGAVEHAGSYGVHIGIGCSGIRLVRNRIRDLGAGGIKVGDWTSAKDAPSGAQITDNRIADGGLIYPSGIGVLVLHSGGNRIAHNEIRDFFYTGISVGWTWGYRESVATGNVVEYNHVHRIGKRLLSDMGGIYTLGPSPGTVLRNNRIHDIDAFDYGGWGIYFDEGSTGILAEDNVVHDTKDGGFHQHYGKGNIVRNNILAFAREAQIGRSRLEGHLSFTFERNLVVWSEGVFFRKGYRDTPGEQVAFDHNLYWAGGAPFSFADLSLDDWRKKGHDAKSVVADPLFVDVEKRDFSLRPGSPALPLGFRPIDLSTVGPRVLIK